MNNLQEALQFDALYESMEKCKNGKMWKSSVARYYTHGIEETLRLESEIENGTYLPRKPHTFKLTYPKQRDCSSTHIRDRIVQRSVNDSILYPEMTRSFILDNAACQKGKGTTFAMDRLNTMLRRYYINHGSSDGWVLRCDIKGYYKSIRHGDADRLFTERIGQGGAEMCSSWLRRQYPGGRGYDPGSQMVQIIGISLLDRLDHVAKEQLRAKYYGRYMDDFYIISDNREFLQTCLTEMGAALNAIGLHLHGQKTRIYPLKDGIDFLGFTFKLTESGKVLRLIDPKNVKHERLKLRRMARLVVDGIITEEKYWECFEAWVAHARLGNTWKVQQRMRKYAKDVLRGAYENQETDYVDFGREEGRKPQRQGLRDGACG